MSKTKEATLSKLEEKLPTKLPQQFTYWLRPKINEQDSIGLSKYGRSKFPGTVEVIRPGLDHQRRVWKTGLDEFAPEVQMLPSNEKEKKMKEIVELRESLEKMTGFDLSCRESNDFWESETVTVTFSENARPLKPSLNPIDKIKVLWLKAKGNIPFGDDDLYNPRYSGVPFYIETDEMESSKKKNKRNLYKEAISAGVKLEDNYDKLHKICILLQLTRKVNISQMALSDLLDNYIEVNKNNRNELETFVEYAKMDEQELSALYMFNRALHWGIVKYDSSTKVYHRGGTNFAATKGDSIKFLTHPENASHFAEIKNELDKRELQNRGID